MIRVLVVAGLDPSGRAGALADCEAIRSRAATPLVALTAITAQGKRFALEPVSPRMLDAQLAAVHDVEAIKVGMVPDRACLKIIARWIRKLEVPTVVDPVIKTSRGEKLSSLTARDFMALPSWVALTPNADEAKKISHPTMVVKSVRPACDVVVIDGVQTMLEGEVLQRNHRGTGCRFASVLAVELARGQSLVEAARSAKNFVAGYLRTAAPRR
jgi:hydroxymethylpyrimidine/phosphomethylpyrimidine kinase